jgi:hypothetical protein
LRVCASGASCAVAEEVLLREHVEVDVVVLSRPEVTAVRAVLEHDRHLEPLSLGLCGTADLNPHPVALPVAVAVELCLDEDDLLDRLREVELRLGLAVLDLEPRRRRRIGGRSGAGGERTQAQQRDGQRAALAKSRWHGVSSLSGRQTPRGADAPRRAYPGLKKRNVS